MMMTSAYRMRPLTWVLLALLTVLLVMIVLTSITDINTTIIQGLAVFLSLVVLSIGMLIIRRLNQRLARLSEIAYAIGEGNYQKRSNEHSQDAIGLLAATINKMAAQVESSMQKLEQQQQTLEQSSAELAQINQQLAQEYQWQTSFGNFLKSLNTVDINTIVQKGLDYSLQVANAVLAQCYILDNDNLVKITEQGIDKQALVQFSHQQLQQGLVGQALQGKEWIIVQDIDTEVFAKINLGLAEVNLHSIYAIPIIFQGKGLGVLLLGCLHSLDQSNIRLLNTLVDALGGALNNALTYKMVQQQALRLEQANQELLEADRMRSEFVANMSHELRTPLNSIIGFSSVLLKNKKQNLSKQDLNYSEKIYRNGKHLLGLINDILDLSKIEAGRMAIERQLTNIVAVAHDIVDILQTQAHAKHIELRYQVEDSVPHITTDADKLRQVLLNLISNAIKFTEKGYVEVRVYVKSPFLAIAVQDTGIGIEEDKLALIFEPFRQADGSTTRRFGGTGLGLSISESIVELLGGKITVTSQPKQGSVFTVTLPLDQPITDDSVSSTATAINIASSSTVAQEINSENIKPINKTKATVLVVDDDPDARDLLASYMVDLGVEVLQAENGEQALAFAKQYQPNLITLDLMMSGMDGWEVLKRLKADPELQSISVAIISIVANRNQAKVLGAVEALTKPVAQNDLLSLLNHHLPAHTIEGVLVVDDNPDVWDLFRTLLEPYQCEIKTAASGKQALQVLENYVPDLIFLDLMMPEMDGLTFLRILRTEQRFMNLPVIVVTAKQLSDTEKRELEMRVVQLIQKGDEHLEQHVKNIVQQVIGI